MICTLLLTGCQYVQGSAEAIGLVAPATDKALDKVLSETWDSKVPCSFPARAWIERAATIPNEGQRFVRMCDPNNLMNLKKDED